MHLAAIVIFGFALEAFSQGCSPLHLVYGTPLKPRYFTKYEM
jgi:hypothetical protein